MRYEKDVENLIDHAVKSFGRLDIAVNNAGTEGTPGSVLDATPEITQQPLIPMSWAFSSA